MLNATVLSLNTNFNFFILEYFVCHNAIQQAKNVANAAKQEPTAETASQCIFNVKSDKSARGKVCALLADIYTLYRTLNIGGYEGYVLEIRIIKILKTVPAKIAEAGAAHSPALVANYAYELAKEFNQYYHDTPILREENQALLQYRLVLVETIAKVLAKAMSILGITLPERM